MSFELSIDFGDMPADAPASVKGRRCGSCTLCCKLMPTAEIEKPANVRCKHQFHGGCRIYATRPHSCRFWSCLWLIGEHTAELSRPDRSRYVVDPLPDAIKVIPEPGAEPEHLPVIQIWCDPQHRDAHRDPALRRLLESMNRIGLVRYSESEAITIVPPAMCRERQWMEIHSGVVDFRSREERRAELAKAWDR